MAKINAYICVDGRFSITIDNKPYTLEKDHPCYDDIVTALKKKDGDTILKLITIPNAVNHFGDGHVHVKDERVYFKDEVVSNSLATRILQMMKDGFDVKPLVLFLENLMQNPSKQSVDELYLFLENSNLPITDDGHFLAYKRVGPNFESGHRNADGSVNINSPGSVHTMERNKVDDVRNNTCSQGLHFASISYLPHFGVNNHSQDRIVILKINPKDVVSIPVDYNNAKGRTCRYEVVDEWCGWQEFVSQHQDKFTKSVVTDYKGNNSPEPKDTSFDKTETRAWNNGLDDGYDCGFELGVSSPEKDINIRDDVDNIIFEYLGYRTSGIYVEAFIEGFENGWEDARNEVDYDYYDYDDDPDDDPDDWNKYLDDELETNGDEDEDTMSNEKHENNQSFDKTKTRAWINGYEDGYDFGSFDVMSKNTYNPETAILDANDNRPVGGIYRTAFLNGYYDGWVRCGGGEVNGEQKPDPVRCHATSDMFDSTNEKDDDAINAPLSDDVLDDLRRENSYPPYSEEIDVNFDTESEDNLTVNYFNLGFRDASFCLNNNWDINNTMLISDRLKHHDIDPYSINGKDFIAGWDQYRGR